MCNKMSMSEAGKLGAIASKATLQKQKLERIEAYNKNPKLCLFCNTPIDYKRHNRKNFCNSSCSASYSNYRRIRKIKEIIRNDKVTYEGMNGIIVSKPTCIYCGKICKKNAGKYCSVKCLQDYRWHKTKQKIEQEKAVSSKNPRQAKRYLKETQGCKCAIPHCGISEWHGQPVLLIMDHVNGDSTDWSLPNLRLICSNCDAQTPFYKARNKGNGRHSRRQRYKEGKSY
jgi:hypothetical protein